MSKYAPFLLAVTVAVAAVSAPVAVTLFLAYKQSVSDAEQRVLALAGEVLRRSNETSRQIQSAQQQLEANVAHEPCGPAGLATMQAIDMGSSYLQAVGYVDNNHLICSSLGAHGSAYPIGAPDYVSALGYAVRLAVELPPGSGRHFFLSEHHGFAAIVHRELAIDVFIDQPTVSLGLVGGRENVRVVGRGEFRPEWIARLHQHDEVAFTDAGHIVGLKRSNVGDFIVYAALPTAELRHSQQALAWKLVPIGVAVGVLIAMLVLRFLRMQQSLRSQLRSALKRNEFFLLYQPIVESVSQRIVGAEALIRWRRRDGELVRPDLFIPAAEADGFITRITGYVFQQVANDVPALLALQPDFHISINIAAADMELHETVARLKQLNQSLSAAPRTVVVELTERGFLHADRAREQINRIRELAVGVAIDDFGTGYSSLSHLENFALDYLKIDKSFIDTVGTDAPTSQVVLHIIAMAKSLNLEMIAEGVETAAQAAFLRERGVHYMQGWHFGRPMSAAALADVLQKQQQPDQ